MKHMMLITTLFIAVALTAGCTKKDEKSTVGAKQNEIAAVQLDKAKADTNAAVQAMQDYTYAQKANFVDDMKKGMAEMQTELDRLSAKVDKSNSTAQADAKARLDAVRLEWIQAKKQLDQAESANESTWNDVKNGFKKSYDVLKDSVGKARQWLSDKIEP